MMSITKIQRQRSLATANSTIQKKDGMGRAEIARLGLVFSTGKMPNCIGPEQAWVTNHNFRSGIPLPFPASPILLATPLRRLEVEMVPSPTTPNEPVTRTTFPDRCRGGARDKHPER